jgi:GntR family transcriptional regulator
MEASHAAWSGRRHGGTAYGAIAERLRQEIREHRYPGGVALPTEMELAEIHHVSRQTVRRAFQDLVAEGLVRRVPGRGTYANDHPRGKYIQTSGSIDDLMALSIDTDLDIVRPPSIGVDIDAAGRLRLDRDDVVIVRFRRLHLGRPFCVTEAYLPVAIGRGLMDVPELRQPGVRPNMTVLSVVQRLAGRPIAGADQSITATPASVQVAAELECATGDPVLRIDRLYFDHDGELLELAVNHFSPDRYTYRFQMRAHAR